MNKLLSLTLLSCLLLFDLVARAQTSAQIGTGNLVPATTLYGPVYRYSSTSTTNGARVNMLWTAAEMAAAGIPAGSLITGVEFNKVNTANFTGTVPFKMLVANTSNTALSTTHTWASILNTHTEVINSTTYNLPATTGWVTFNFSTPLTYTGGAFEVATEHSVAAITNPRSTDAIKWEYTDGHETKIVGVASNTGATLNGTVANYKERPNIKIIYTLATPCTAPPTPGTAVASVVTTCPNTDFTLNLTGNSIGSGQTYQWESSTTGSAPWTPVGIAATGTALTISLTTTTHYRVAVTCGTQTAYSTSVQVSTNATPLAGVYTINKNSPASATNFVSFAALINELDCRGVSAPVTFNVVAGSGPYNEQVMLANIPGVSATNTVTFNGNGNTLTSTLASATDALITLNGSKYIRFNNLNLNAASSTSGVGIYLTNGAQFNNFTNNTVTLNTTSTSTSYGIRVQTGANHDNLFQGNTIIGGYYGLYHYGTSALNLERNNFINNEFRDPYYYGMYFYYSSGSVIEGNEIHRPTRTAGTTFYSLYGSNATSLTISKNRIHTIGGSTIYGIYNTSSDSPVASPTVVMNNLIYNLNNTGSTYAIYNSGSNSAHYYHNTINLDNTSNTGIVRGFYQTTSASDIRFINNIISMDAGTSGVKYALYFGTAASSITSNNNVIYIAQTTNASVGYYSGGFTTLANWQTANGGAYDQNSVAANPVFIDAANGNFRPNTVALNGIGQVLTNVTEDITGATRSTTAPDPGAYEFDVPANDVTITDISGPVSGCGLTATETITITIRNFGSATQTSIPVSYSINGTQTGTGTWTGSLAPNATATFTFTQTTDLSVPGAYVIEAETDLANDSNPTNDSYSINIGNSLLPALPVAFDFETPANGIGAMRVVTNSNSNITEGAAASNGTGSAKGMIMDGVNSTQWEIPAGILNPWANNPDHLAAVYLCLTPNATQQDSLILTFDLKQLYKGSNLNTNFRVTANGQQIGSTYKPPFAGWGTGGATWQHIRVDLSQFANSSSLEIGLESSVKEEFANGTGTANLIDNINLYRVQNPKTGVKDNLLQSLVNVYPNPSNGIFNVSLPQGKACQLEVTDLTGKTILKTDAKNQQAQLNLQGKAKGIYILKITSDGQMATRKLIVE